MPEHTVAFIRLMRPVNCVLMGFAVIVGAALADKTISQNRLEPLLLGFVTAFTLTAASMAINDYYDRKIDAINEPNRPIPSGLVKPTQALLFASVLSATGFLAAFFTNVECLAVSILAWVIFVAYTTRGKATGFIGNVLVSLCVVVPFIYGSFLATRQIQLVMLLFVSMVFLANMGREVNKGVVDVEGDKANAVKTLAVRFGAKTASTIAAGFYITAVLLSPLPVLLSLGVNIWFIPLVLVTDTGLLLSATLLLRDYSRDNARKIKNYVLVWFLFGLLAFMFGTV